VLLVLLSVETFLFFAVIAQRARQQRLHSFFVTEAPRYLHTS
jgi:hypothetical protein